MQHRDAFRSTTATAVAALLAAACAGDTGTSPPGAPDASAAPARCAATGYDGDESCLEPPAPGAGFQLHFGPRDHADPAEVAPYLVAPGEEVTECIFLKTPNDAEVWIAGYQGRMRPGTHHMITYLQDRERADSVEPGPCEQGVDSTFLLGSQEVSIDLLPAQAAPEEQRYAMRLGGRRQAAIQLHYLNSTDAPILREAWINILYAEPAQVETEVSSLFWIGGLGMNVLPGQRQIIKAVCEVPANAPAELALSRITGHFHAHTERMSIWKVSGAARTLVYEGYDYNHPGWLAFNSIADNPAPNPATGVAGSLHDGRLPLAPGDRLEYECEVMNDTALPLQFDDAVYTAEMCNVFGMYVPTMGGAWRCFNF